MKKVLLALLVSSLAVHASAQDMVIFQSNMRSKAANKFYEEEFRTVGSYQVKGNSYLFKGKNVSDIFTTLGYGVNVGIVFDAYTQQVAVLQPSGTAVINLSLDEVDSFYLKVDNEGRFKGPAMFRNMSKIDASRQEYMQELVNGTKYKLYKHHYAELENASDNIAQSNLKQFVMKSDWYFVDLTTSDRKLIKIKPNLKSLKAYFKTSASLPILENAGSLNTEDKVTLFFEALNS
ncbi:MAG: hypothetical protein EOP48_06530 [Sphingobacteriales bacterium]|nr:MAG: hypothetical protein EOP48_06530 [Sphingobacteriales bacterium]